MAIKPRGLPATFRLDVAKHSSFNGPVRLGDYLDDDPVAASARPQSAASPTLRAERPTAPPPQPAPPALPSPAAPARPGPPRKQINMNPETLRMVSELMHQIQTYSGQEDAKASEMFHGLVSALHEARGYMDFANTSARGRWGSPTARAFPVALKTVFRHAIAEWCAKNRR